MTTGAVETSSKGTKKDLILAQFKAGVTDVGAIVTVVASQGETVSASEVNSLRKQYDKAQAKAAKPAKATKAPAKAAKKVAKKAPAKAKKAAPKKVAKKAKPVKAAAKKAPKTGLVHDEAESNKNLIIRLYNEVSKEPAQIIAAGKKMGKKLTPAYVYKTLGNYRRGLRAEGKLPPKGAKKVVASKAAPKVATAPVEGESFRAAVIRHYESGIEKPAAINEALQAEGRVKGNESKSYIYTILSNYKATKPAKGKVGRPAAAPTTSPDAEFEDMPSIEEARTLLAGVDPRVRQTLEALAYKVGAANCTRILGAIEVHHTALAGLSRAG